MKYAIFEHTQNNLGLINIGDHIQTCAAEQFIPNVDFYVERDALNRLDYQKAKIIMNGWFTDAPENWPPNRNLIPLFISFHLQPSSAKIILAKQENIDYLKIHEPIGCRDYKTLELLEASGIKAYFSFCLTTTLDEKYKSDERDNKIYLVDPLYSYNKNILKQVDWYKVIKKVPLKKLYKLKDYFKKSKVKLTDFVPNHIIKESIKISHFFSNKSSNEEQYSIAKGLLNKYSSAKLVITSRIHCALPCLSFGTPVLFVMEGLTDEGLHLSRFRGILDHINILTLQPKKEFEKYFGKSMNIFHPSEIDWNNPPKNPSSYKVKSEELKAKCRAFINENEF